MSAFNLDTVVRHYLVAALWTSELDDHEPDAFDPDSVERTRTEVSGFLARNEEDLLESGLSDSHIGHNLWLTRNGHGTGFWDRDLGAIGDRLTEASERLGEVWLCEYGDSIELV
jgi:hypothetical protein